MNDGNSGAKNPLKIEFELRSEFGRVRVGLDTSANGPRLLIEDLKTGSRIFMDPLELESIATATHEDLAYLVNPARRWQL